MKKKFPAMYNAFMLRRASPCGHRPRRGSHGDAAGRARSSIREIIPFPMNKNAQDVMMGAPSTVEQKQLDELHIQITALEEE